MNILLISEVLNFEKAFKHWCFRRMFIGGTKFCGPTGNRTRIYGLGNRYSIR